MSKYFDAALKSLRTPVCEGRGVKVFRLDEADIKLNEAADTTLSKVKGNIPVRAKGVDLELKLTRNRNAKNAFNVSITGAGKAVRVIGGASGNATVGDTITRINKHGDRPTVTLRENEGPKYPDIEVQLTGNDGNAFAILGAVSKAMRRAKVDSKDIDAFMDEATKGDYNHLLQTAMKWVNVG